MTQIKRATPHPTPATAASEALAGAALPSLAMIATAASTSKSVQTVLVIAWRGQEEIGSMLQYTPVPARYGPGLIGPPKLENSKHFNLYAASRCVNMTRTKAVAIVNTSSKDAFAAAAAAAEKATAALEKKHKKIADAEEEEDEDDKINAYSVRTAASLEPLVEMMVFFSK